MSKPPDDSVRSYTDAPPSYTSTLSSTTPLPALLAPLTTHLSTLPSRLRQSTAQSHTRQTDTDLALLSHILPHIEAFLLSSASELASARAGVAQLIAVPLAAVPQPWALSEVEEWRKAGEVVTVARVDVPADGKVDGTEGREAARHEKGLGREEKEDGNAEQKKTREFDDWGRWDDGEGSDDSARALWWRDEAMARRLAGYLQPRERVETGRREIMAQVKKDKERKGLLGWGRKTSDAKPAEASAGSKGPQVGPVATETEGASMTVRAREVTFRKENEFGVWESLSGFAVVVTIRVRKT